MLDSGQIIADRYELLKQLGRGGFLKFGWHKTNLRMLRSP